MAEERITIERMSYGSAAVGRRSDGKTVFVEGAAPGEVVEALITEEKASFARARTVRVLEAAASRVREDSREGSLCQASCGGCPWAHLTYETQLAAKRSNVVDALVRTAHMDAERAEELVLPCVASKRTWGYRNKLEMGVTTDARGAFELGFFREGTHDLDTPATCPLAHKNIARAPKALQGALRFAQGSQDLGIFRVGVRGSLRTHDVEVALWTRPGPFPRAHVAGMMKSALRATSVVRVIADPGRARVIKGVEALEGRGWWEESMKDVRLCAAAPSFFQVNTAQAERLVEDVLEGLGGADALDGALVADLYSGVGTFSVPLSLAGADVIAVESAGSSVRDLRRNANANDADIEVIGGDAARELPDLGELDFLVVDPPRAGLANGVVGSIAAAAPERVAYVSCDPATWARDVARFEERGYRLMRARPVDLFPQTYHVEVSSTFEWVG